MTRGNQSNNWLSSSSSWSRRDNPHLEYSYKHQTYALTIDLYWVMLFCCISASPKNRYLHFSTCLFELFGFYHPHCAKGSSVWVDVFAHHSFSTWCTVVDVGRRVTRSEFQMPNEHTFGKITFKSSESHLAISSTKDSNGTKKWQQTVSPLFWKNVFCLQSLPFYSVIWNLKESALCMKDSIDTHCQCGHDSARRSSANICSNRARLHQIKRNSIVSIVVALVLDPLSFVICLF